MTPQFKTELQKLIDDAAEKHIKESVYNVIDGKFGFKAGCEFLIPLIEVLIKTRDNYIFYRNEDKSRREALMKRNDKDLLNLLRGER